MTILIYSIVNKIDDLHYYDFTNKTLEARKQEVCSEWSNEQNADWEHIQHLKKVGWDNLVFNVLKTTKEYELKQKPSILKLVRAEIVKKQIEFDRLPNAYSTPYNSIRFLNKNKDYVKTLFKENGKVYKITKNNKLFVGYTTLSLEQRLDNIKNNLMVYNNVYEDLRKYNWKNIQIELIPTHKRYESFQHILNHLKIEFSKLADQGHDVKIDQYIEQEDPEIYKHSKLFEIINITTNKTLYTNVTTKELQDVFQAYKTGAQISQNTYNMLSLEGFDNLQIQLIDDIPCDSFEELDRIRTEHYALNDKYQAYIYIIFNNQPKGAFGYNKFYIGQTKRTPAERFQQHRYIDDPTGKHSRKFYDDINNLNGGWESVKIAVLQEIQESQEATKAERNRALNEAEAFWIKTLGSIDSWNSKFPIVKAHENDGQKSGPHFDKAKFKQVMAFFYAVRDNDAVEFGNVFEYLHENNVAIEMEQQLPVEQNTNNQYLQHLAILDHEIEEEVEKSRHFWNNNGSCKGIEEPYIQKYILDMQQKQREGLTPCSAIRRRI